MHRAWVLREVMRTAACETCPEASIVVNEISAIGCRFCLGTAKLLLYLLFSSVDRVRTEILGHLREPTARQGIRKKILIKHAQTTENPFKFQYI